MFTYSQEDYFDVLKKDQRNKLMELLNQLREWIQSESSEQNVALETETIEQIEKLKEIVQKSSEKGLECKSLSTIIYSIQFMFS